jgi:hypothetical protein
MPEASPSRWLTTAGWDDVPHLDDKTKAELLASTPAYLRDARSKGTPSLGSGAIYPVPASEIACDPIQIPAWWPRGYALDVGWNKTAAVWGAHDRETDVLYLYSEHYAGRAEPSTHAAAVTARGAWIPGVIDPASRGRSQVDGQQLMARYRELGLALQPAENAVEAGIHAVWMRLETGRLRVFRTLQNWFAEHQLYRRDENGRIVKAHDHLMDATRYLVANLQGFKVRPLKGGDGAGTSFRAADTTMGY